MLGVAAEEAAFDLHLLRRETPGSDEGNKTWRQRVHQSDSSNGFFVVFFATFKSQSDKKMAGNLL